ncbi:hypothetical protein [Marinobacter apostichopi]|uniref:hypothetical protein n=1 Tax=Marinobacter apostichopi TaxID=3035454 RepID=UPI002572AB4C|nr:hypothetical protein [Marinobacter sp. LA51]
MNLNRSLLAALVLAMASGVVVAEEVCSASATTDLERLYCDVVAQGGGQGLPSQADFRRNQPQVQALLLRRPAKRLGLSVPAVTTEPAQSKPAPASQASTKPPKPEPEQADSQPTRFDQLADCALKGERIVCPDRQFKLALNQPNRALAPGVLEDQNRLGLRPFQGDRSDEQQVRAYLSGAYDRYIPKMLAIGLGANTMSFTAFHNAFHTLEDDGVDFAERMERTFQLLKQDKLNLTVQARYHDRLPENLALCEVINPDIIVCDNVATNWVFVSRTQ